ncbi:TIGR03862 family flavoprotein [Demequina sp. TTPB684]|uniref:NAD(P)/FAD-dependent oxidoreductase n=1 Tax=unclassified Demequina TaxID=2620311 RepID=UPI001CF24BD4|nr:MULTISPECIES: TIGR03862 family flavoprotein [unclassified Demequina]MCB2412765.1 TIGR03862 family flavoprotein [Demequina sp. TTPB684]UPU88858.1 TIGR03862 family flavoprotein [Demequina sp. TMPB413]
MHTARVIGGGPAGLMAAEVLARAGVSVTVHERMPSPGRKFLLAGHGGLNLTHSEDRERFVTRYGTSADRISPMLEVFGPEHLRAWCAELGEPTFVGSSGRVFPQAFRATPLFRAWLARLEELGVRIERRTLWSGWAHTPAAADDAETTRADASAGALLITDADGRVTPAAADVVIFALGGASWPHLGADGTWVDLFAERDVEVTPLRAANVGVRVDWSEVFAERFAGTPLKNVSLSVPGQSGEPRRGDAMLTRSGIEGGPVYASGAAIRDALDATAPRAASTNKAARCILEVDLRPDHSVGHVAERLRHRRPKDSTSNWLRRSIGLDPAAIGLLREASGGTLPSDADAVARLIKAVPLTVTGTMPIDRAISTAGGIAWSEVDEHLMLRRMPGTFVAGEMLDWEAPTGGYLLQASFSTGVVAARGALRWLKG